jgi:hypothetical protein
MKASRLPRKAASISDSLHRQLNMYALAASAAGVGVLALPLPAEAKIIYTPANVYIRFGQLVPLDLNHDGVNDFAFSNKSNSGATFYSRIAVGGYKGNAIVLHFSGGQRIGAADLRAGVSVGPNRRFSYNGALPMAGYCLGGATTTCHSFYGPWAQGGKGVKNRYLGLKFRIKGKVHYAWARLTVSIGAPKTHSIVGHLTGYAYETIPGKPIIAGATKRPDNAEPTASLTPTPEPVTLGTLALGAPGLSIWRREEPVAATPDGNDLAQAGT